MQLCGIKLTQRRRGRKEGGKTVGQERQEVVVICNYAGLSSRSGAVGQEVYLLNEI